VYHVVTKKDLRAWVVTLVATSPLRGIMVALVLGGRNSLLLLIRLKEKIWRPLYTFLRSSEPKPKPNPNLYLKALYKEHMGESPPRGGRSIEKGGLEQGQHRIEIPSPVHFDMEVEEVPLTEEEKRTALRCELGFGFGLGLGLGPTEEEERTALRCELLEKKRDP